MHFTKDKQNAICVGLISDTHTSQCGETLPQSVFDVLQNVDIILHAGDVGEPKILNQLSTIAPVVAVHGNDDTKQTQQKLPYQQLVFVGGQQILLWHGHYSDPSKERASRVGDWASKLTRQAERGKRVGAQIVVFGHIHIPLTYQYDDMLIINPGALASGNFVTRQDLKTVALLFIYVDKAVSVNHIDLASPNQVFKPKIDWEAEFDVALGQFVSKIN